MLNPTRQCSYDHEIYRVETTKKLASASITITCVNNAQMCQKESFLLYFWNNG